MAELLESAMLVCFGLSWPINLAKNVKAKTAKSMSLQFILLIIAGYLAGISAKIYNHKLNYVLIVYFLNLMIVSGNLIVYFINLRYDKQRNIRTSDSFTKSTPGPDRTNSAGFQNQGDEDEMEKYRNLNHIAESGGIVLFGSNLFASMPVGELAQTYHIHEALYNRSVKDIKIDQIESYLKVCLYDLNPHKIFVNMGDCDLQDKSLDVDAFISKYEWLLYMIHTKTTADIYIVSIVSDSAPAIQINSALKKLASKTGCKFIDASSALDSNWTALRLFEILKVHIRNHPLNFADAMELGALYTKEDDNHSAPAKEPGNYETTSQMAAGSRLARFSQE